MKPSITCNKQNVAYENRYITVNNDDVTFPDGTNGQYVKIATKPGKGGVFIAHFTNKGVKFFGVVNQYRYPINQHTTEFPRGMITDTSAQEALREFTEETGANCLNATRLGTIYADTGMLSNEISVWSGEVDPTTINHTFTEEETGAKPLWVPEAQFEYWINQGHIVCGITLAAWTLYKNHTTATT